MMKKFFRVILAFFIVLTTLGFVEPKVDDKQVVSCPELELLGISVKQKGDYILLYTDNLFMKLSPDDDTIYVYDRIYCLRDNIRQEGNHLIVSKKSINLINNIILYNNAVIDAKIADQDEIRPLLSIDKSVEKVLVGKWHKYPESYINGKKTTTKYGEIWVFTHKEIFEFARKNKLGDDIVLRLEQLMGLPPDKGYTHFSLFWVNPKDLLRPAFNNNIYEDRIGLDLIEDKEFQVWFNGNVEYSYKNNRYPWTRLGYTYDWANNATKYGLTEFIIKKDSPITIEKTYTNKEFFDLLRSADKS